MAKGFMPENGLHFLISTTARKKIPQKKLDNMEWVRDHISTIRMSYLFVPMGLTKGLTLVNVLPLMDAEKQAGNFLIFR